MHLRVRRSIQWDEYSCGSHALYAVMRWHSVDTTYRHCRRLCRTTKSGIHTKDLVNAAEHLGFTCKVYKMRGVIASIRRELESGMPLVCAHEEGVPHFTVIKGLVDRTVFFADSSFTMPSCLEVDELTEVIGLNPNW